MWQYNYDYYDLAPDELEHHGVLGMRWGHRKVAQAFNALGNYHTKRAASLQSKADVKRNSFMNTNRRKINYATKEQRYANAEKFHNRKALGLSYGNKLFGSTLDYRVNKSRAGKDAIMKEKYSEAKKGTTNKVNRLEYRAGKQLIKANKAYLNRNVSSLKAEGKGKAYIDDYVNKHLGEPIDPTTWTMPDAYKDKHAKLGDYVHRRQLAGI